PRVPSGSRFRGIASQSPPLNTAEEEPTRAGLQNEARILRRRRPATARELWIAGEAELVHGLAAQGHGNIGAIDGDLVVIPLAYRARSGRKVAPLEPVDRVRDELHRQPRAGRMSTRAQREPLTPALLASSQHGDLDVPEPCRKNPVVKV